MPNSYSITAEHRYISDVLKFYCNEYAQLEKDMENFAPRSRDTYEPEYQREFEKLVKLNPNASIEDLKEIARGDIEVGFKNQFSEKFNNRIFRLLVPVVFMSHALCEALINQILILRFYDEGISDLFDVWDRAKFIDKWLLAPKSFLPDYDFEKDGQIYQSLRELATQRNNFTHYKPMIKVDGIVLHGKEQKRKTFAELMEWIKCFISLPYDLAILSSLLMKNTSYQMLLHRDDIPIAEGHKKEIERIKIKFLKSQQELNS